MMTPKQEAALREYLQEAIVPLIEQVLVKKLGQAMSFAAEQLIQPKPASKPAIKQDLTPEQPAQQQKEGFASPGGGYVPAIPRPMPLDWKLVPRKATPEMLKAMDECAQEGYDERLYAGMASSVYMAAWDASPVMGTLPEQPAQQEPVAHSIVAGALFDFMGWLTSRNERLVLSSTENAAPAADAIKDFAHMRNLNIDDAKVRDWQEHLTSQPAQQQEPVAKVCHDLDGHIGWNPNLTELPAEGTELYTSPPASKPWIGLTDKEFEAIIMSDPHATVPVRLWQLIQDKLKEKNT